MIKQELGQKTLGKGGDCFLVRINGIDRNEERECDQSCVSNIRQV